jgi:fused signal recognition particle receptor
VHLQVLAGTVKAAQDSGADVVLCDTSGRLHTNWRLMDELQLVVQEIDQVQKGAPHETLLVLDGSTGLNMMNQVRSQRQSLYSVISSNAARAAIR